MIAMLLCDNKTASIRNKIYSSTAYRIEFLTLPIFHYPSSLLWTLVAATGDHLRLASIGNRLSVYRNFAASVVLQALDGHATRRQSEQAGRLREGMGRERERESEGNMDGGEPVGSQYFAFIALLSRN